MCKNVKTISDGTKISKQTNKQTNKHVLIVIYIVYHDQYNTFTYKVCFWLMCIIAILKQVFIERLEHLFILCIENKHDLHNKYLMALVSSPLGAE